MLPTSRGVEHAIGAGEAGQSERHISSSSGLHCGPTKPQSDKQIGTSPGGQVRQPNSGQHTSPSEHDCAGTGPIGDGVGTIGSGAGSVGAGTGTVGAGAGTVGSGAGIVGAGSVGTGSVGIGSGITGAGTVGGATGSGSGHSACNMSGISGGGEQNGNTRSVHTATCASSAHMIPGGSCMQSKVH